MIATAAPIATPEPLPDELVLTAEPSPVALPVVAFDDASRNGPCAVITNAAGRYAAAVELETLMAIAAATEIGVPPDDVPSDPDADGAVPLEPSVPAGASPIAKPCSLLTCLSTVGEGVGDGEGAAGEPAALACAIAVLVPEFTAVKPTPPPAVTFCCVLADVLSVAKVSAIDAPTAAVLPAAEAIVDVLVEPAFVAETVSDPPMLSGAAPTVPIRAYVLSLTIASPSEGVTETAPADPIDAVVVTLSLEFAVSVRLLAFVKLTPLASNAPTALLTIDNAIEAPMPTLPLPLLELLVGVGKAEVVVSAVSVAVSTTSPPPAFTLAEGLISAAVLSLTMLIASDPAMPMLAPPLPEVALAVKLSAGFAVPVLVA